MGAKDEHTVKTSWRPRNIPGVIDHCLQPLHCPRHQHGQRSGGQKEAVETGYWPLFRYNPELLKEGKNPLILDSGSPKMSFRDYAYHQTRFKSLTKSKPEEAERLMLLAQEDVNQKWAIYEALAKQAAAAQPGAVQPPTPQA